MIVAALRRLASVSAVVPTPQARSLPTTASGWRQLYWGGLPTNAGPTVNEYTSLAHGTVYACVRLLSATIAALPLHLKRREGRTVETVDDHPLAVALHLQANQRQVAFQALQFLLASLFLRGNGLAIVQRNGVGEAAAYWPIRWDHVRVDVEAGEPIFIWRPTTAAERVLRRGEFWHVHGLSTDGVVGLSPIAVQREAVGYGLALQEYGARLFSNGAAPSGVITHPERLGGGDEEEADGIVRRLRTQFEDLYSGLGNAHRVAILEEGMKWEKMGIAPEDAQFLESRRFNRSEIAGWFGVPSHLIGADEKGEFSIDTLSLEFVKFHLTPHLVLLEQTIARDLLTELEREELFAKFNTGGILRGDQKSRVENHASAITNGWMTRNEVRELEDLNPLEGLDEPLAPLNMAPAGGSTGMGDPARAGRPDGMEGRGAEGRARLALVFRQPLEDLVGRLVAAEAREIRELVGKVFGPREGRSAGGRGQDVEAFLARMEQLHDPEGTFRALILKRSRPIVASLARAMIDQASAEVGREPERAGLEDWIDAAVGAFAARYAIASLRSVDAAMTAAPEAPHEAVDEVLATWKEQRPGRAAAKESVHQARAAAREAFRRSGVTLIRWRARGDSCPFCLRLDGRVVAIEGGSFVGEGEEFHAEGRPSLSPRTAIGHPPLHRGCDCELEAVTS